MAFLTCPWCLNQQLVSDEAGDFRCQGCSAEIRFFRCPNCSLVQTVHASWRVFTCGKCEAKVELPPRWSYDRATSAMRVEGVGRAWPQF